MPGGTRTGSTICVHRLPNRFNCTSPLGLESGRVRLHVSQVPLFTGLESELLEQPSGIAGALLGEGTEVQPWDQSLDLEPALLISGAVEEAAPALLDVELAGLDRAGDQDARARLAVVIEEAAGERGARLEANG